MRRGLWGSRARRAAGHGVQVRSRRAPLSRFVSQQPVLRRAGREAADSRRNPALARAGYRVVRIEASLVVSNIESALDRIRAALVG